MAQNDDFASLAWVEAAAPVRWQAAPAASSLAALDVHRPTVVTARLHLAERRLVATSLVQDGGWRLLVDGVARATTRTNGAFVGAWIEPRAGSLALVYRPLGLVPGCLLAALALVFACAWLLAPRDDAR